MVAGEDGSQSQRRAVRTPLCVTVMVLDDSAEPLCLRTRDISDGGVFLVMDQPHPPIGHILRIQVVGLGTGDAPIVEVRVMRSTREGIGCAYL